MQPCTTQVALTTHPTLFYVMLLPVHLSWYYKLPLTSAKAGKYIQSPTRIYTTLKDNGTGTAYWQAYAQEHETALFASGWWQEKVESGFSP